MMTFTNFLFCLALCSSWLLLSASVTASPLEVAKRGIFGQLQHLTSPSNSTDHNSRGVDPNWHEEMLGLINQLRIDSGLPVLAIDERLNDVAQAHSDYQAKINLLTHDDAAGSLGTRVTNSGVVWTRLGENVASGPREVDFVVSLWVDSPGHYANIVGDFNYVGFGLANDDNASIEANKVPFWTQVYAKEPTRS